MHASWLAGRRLTPLDLSAEGNAFTIVRWLLATTVMFSHGWDLTQPERSLDPSVALLGMPVSQLAVFLFFSLSGFLVAGSLVKRGVRDFAVARLLRLVPGLWVMLLVVTVALGALVGTLPFGAFLSHPETWRFVAINGSLMAAHYQLPGVFEALPQPAVNGSLWTIPQEVRCYIVLGLLGAAGALRSRRWLAAAVIIGILMQLAVPADIVAALEKPRRLGLSFFLGVVAWQWRGTLRWSWPISLAAAVLAVALAHLPVPTAAVVVAQQIAFAYLAGVAAFCAPAAIIRLSRRLPDYSYGIYIYAYPAQQLALALGYGTTPLTNIAAGLVLTLPLAAMSWHFVEHPALGLKSRYTKGREPKLSGNFTPGEAQLLPTVDNTAT
jgi:peptidoglycan/LPS O-acetylase OafA/YrhL